MTTAGTIRLPKGVGQLPSWWLDEVPHDTRDDVLRSQRRLFRESIGLPRESHEEETHAIELEKERLDSISGLSTRSIGISDFVEPHAASVSAAHSAKLVAQQLEHNENQDSGSSAIGKTLKFHITMTSDEEGAAVEARRQKDLHSEEYGQQNLRARPGNIKTVESIRLDKRDQVHGDQTDSMNGAAAEFKADESPTTAASAVAVDESAATAARPTGRRSTHDYSVTPPPKKFNTAFTGVSHFDFAMQQRALEKERREKERISRESMSQHHGAVLLADKAAEHKAKDEEGRRKKKEAEDMLKMFKAADLDKNYEVAAELKKLQIETKMKKKEAEENLKGYRER